MIPKTKLFYFDSKNVMKKIVLRWQKPERVGILNDLLFSFWVWTIPFELLKRIESQKVQNIL